MVVAVLQKIHRHGALSGHVYQGKYFTGRGSHGYHGRPITTNFVVTKKHPDNGVEYEYYSNFNRKPT